MTKILHLECKENINTSKLLMSKRKHGGYLCILENFLHLFILNLEYWFLFMNTHTPTSRWCGPSSNSLICSKRRCWLMTRDFTKMWWNYSPPHSCLQTMAIVWTHNLGRSPAYQIDGTLLLPKQHNRSLVACLMPMLALWNFLFPLHINNTRSHYPSRSMFKKCSNFKKLLTIL